MRTRWLLVALVVIPAVGCAGVHPHERERLAHPAMQAPVWPSLDRADQHLFMIREGTEGATASGGGGCGCN